MAALLSHLRVIDFSQYIPGPYATLMLANLGADVVKIERPGGEAMRRIGPLDSDGVSVFYKTMNAGKSVLELDLKSDSGRETFAFLLAKADVLIESFRPGVVERLGFAPESLRARYPRLVVCSLSGYGQTGPYRLKAGHDINYLAFAGMLVSTGTPDTPVSPSPPVADYASAVQAAAAILAALVSREQTDQGAYLDCSIAESVLAWQSNALSNISRDGYSLARGEGNETGGWAAYRIYKTSDGRFVSLGAEETAFWENFCMAVGHLDWIPRQNEPRPQTALINEIAALFAAKPLVEWQAMLGEVDCCFQPVLEHAEVAGHPQVTARKMVSHERWPDPLIQVPFPAWIDGSPPVPGEEPSFPSVETIVESWNAK